MQLYLVCFDISDDRIRYQVGRALQEYGTRVQRSVFEVSVPGDTQLKALREKIADLLESGDDCRFYCLCKSCRQSSTDVSGNRVAYQPAVVLI